MPDPVDQAVRAVLDLSLPAIRVKGLAYLGELPQHPREPGRALEGALGHLSRGVARVLVQVEKGLRLLGEAVPETADRGERLPGRTAPN